MKNTKVTLVPLAPDDREQFILDNQWAFKYGALQEFGKRDDHINFEGEIISRQTIERCIDAPDRETYISTRCGSCPAITVRLCISGLRHIRSMR